MVNPSLQIRLTQKLAMAPQLQQAIRLLQLTRIELRDYIQEVVEANPLLDQEDFSEAPSGDNQEVSLETGLDDGGKSQDEDPYGTDDWENDQWQSEGDQWADSGSWSDDFAERQIE